MQTKVTTYEQIEEKMEKMIQKKTLTTEDCSKLNFRILGNQIDTVKLREQAQINVEERRQTNSIDSDKLKDDMLAWGEVRVNNAKAQGQAANELLKPYSSKRMIDSFFPVPEPQSSQQSQSSLFGNFSSMF